jgi:hypothetical protein
VDLINLLIQEEQFRKLQRLNKKEEKINTITTNQTDWNKTIIRTLIRILTDAINVIHMGAGTIENV